MQSFEDVRSHVASRHRLRSNEPYLISFDLGIDDTRRQGVYLSEIESEDGRRYLRVSSPVAPLGSIAAEKCLRFNWEQRVGYLAVSDLEGVPMLHLCENRPYAQLSAEEVDHVIEEIGPLADRIEKSISAGSDIL